MKSKRTELEVIHEKSALYIISIVWILFLPPLRWIASGFGGEGSGEGDTKERIRRARGREESGVWSTTAFEFLDGMQSDLENRYIERKRLDWLEPAASASAIPICLV
ncbi:MAG: hypothetical protein NTU80_00135 [Verrucomicrobia bacterium]|nr:hypothetical protein [Verrucomicrobiota bacterium]